MEESKAYANLSLGSLLNNTALSLSGADRALLIRLVYGVVAEQIALDYILSNCLKRDLSSLPLPIRTILRMGVYQIVYLDRIPARAAVDESVKLAHRFGHRGTAGLVNAVLRKVGATPSITWPAEGEDGLRYLSVRYSHPEYMVQRWLRNIGREETEALLRANNEVPQLCIRVNSLKTTVTEVTVELKRQGIDVTAGSFAPDCLYVSVPPAFSGKLFREGHYIVQGEASALVSHLLNPQAGETIIDLCAAPGGKTTHIAQLMGDMGTVHALDINLTRLSLVEENASRLGLTSIKTHNVSAEAASTVCQMADRVLLDAPCSGLGVIRHKPDIRHNRSEEDIISLSKMQQNLISGAARLVKRGGRLVYSVCTMEPEETTVVVDGFLSENPDFLVVDDLPALSKRPRSDGSGYHFWPHRDGIDGFYVAVFERAGNSTRVLNQWQ